MAYFASTAPPAARAVAPGALLLRNSRLMSIPLPLPSVSSQTNIWTRPGTSSTHPTAQVIATPTSSHHRGDWGLKRNLPLKVSQKYLKYHSLDTLEHRTTFESAHGEVMVLRRWQEMDIPLTVSQVRLATRTSVFDEIDDVDPRTGRPASPEDADAILAETDFTTPPSRARPSASPTKWRYSGPFMQSLNPKELATYINSQVKPRKHEFLKYVKRHQYLSSHNTLSSIPNRLPTEEELRDIEVNISALRADPLVLEQLVISFLDLPTFSPPPATHPSAGLHYIRTASHWPNHPYAGPQQQSASLPGRQLQGRASNVFAGVGGLVAKVVEVNIASFSDREPANIRDNREVVRWYKPLWATVNPEGAVLLEVQSSVPPAPGYIGPGAETAKPVLEEMMEREWAQREAERVAREQRESRRIPKLRFSPPQSPPPPPQQQQQYHPDQQPYYDQPQQYSAGEGYYPQETYQHAHPQQYAPQHQQPYPPQPQHQEPPAGSGWGSIVRTATRHPPQRQQQQQQQLAGQFTNAADEVLHLLEESQAGGGWGSGGRGGNSGGGY
ncbi:mitochondrial ribosomal protein subunit-domain-containing protein [Tirmania nivea]|nr:mitochondrial ribosomal protein subunit-domain-containing protein [Tirmania nivea]